MTVIHWQMDGGLPFTSILAEALPSSFQPQWYKHEQFRDARGVMVRQVYFALRSIGFFPNSPLNRLGYLLKICGNAVLC